jgi:hypothetical protein
MSKFCSTCGSEEPDDQSIFCRTCGNRFPLNPPEKKSATRPTADHGSQSIPAGGDTVPDERTVKKAPRKRGNFGRFFAFDIFITKTAISVIYCIGAVVLTLVSVLYLVLGIVKPAMLPTIPAQIPTLNTPVFWIAVLILGNLVWRMMCEFFVVMFSINKSLVSIDNTLITYNQPVTADDDTSEYATCPLCSGTVRIDELQKCDRCGIMGCKNCIRTAGIFKRTKTCKTCFNKK